MAGHPAAAQPHPRPPSPRGGRAVLEKAHGQAARRLHHDGLLPAVAWVQFIPDSLARRTPGRHLVGFPSMHLGMRPDAADEAPENPAYAHLQGLTREIDDLKAQF